MMNRITNTTNRMCAIWAEAAAIGFLPVDDPRDAGTIRAIERELTIDELLLRYRNHEHVESLPPGEGVFLACSFWLADVLVMSGRGTRRSRSSSGC